MSFERMPGGMGGEPGLPTAAGGPGVEPSPIALRLQVLATEHWGLLATRSMVWNESFTRAGMFLAALSGAIVALALVAQATAFGDEFALFALVILPVVLFIGVTTYIRIGRSNGVEALCVVGMNRIRRAYLEITPEVEPYLVMGSYDDRASIDQSRGWTPGHTMLVDIVVSTPFVLATINSVITGVIAALVVQLMGAGMAPTIAVAVGVAILSLGVALFRGSRAVRAEMAAFEVKFPPPSGAPPSA